MKVVTEEDVLNNYTFYRKCCLICGLYLKRKIATKKEISFALNSSVSDEYLCSFLKFLETSGFLIVDRFRIPHLYTIKGSELGWFVRKGEEFKINVDYPIKASMGVKPYYYG